MNVRHSVGHSSQRTCQYANRKHAVSKAEAHNKQSNALDKSVSYNLNVFPLPTASFHFLTFPVPCISESCVKVKINLNFYFHTSL